MKVLIAPFMEELVLEFSDKQDYEAFANILRAGVETIQSGRISFDAEFQPRVTRMCETLEGLVIYPQVDKVINSVRQRKH
jgi:hypothetical protein